MNIWAIIPVKSLQLTKSRLTAVLTAQERANLTRHFLQRLLTVLNESKELSQIVVVSRDEVVQAIARAAGAIAIAEPENAGLNKAVHTGVQLTRMGKADRVLILPSDLPYLSIAEVTALIQTAVAEPGNSVICPDRHEQGTNALLIPTQAQFQFQYGVNSFNKHQQEARRCGLGIHIIRSPGWQFDLDTVEDWEMYHTDEAGQAEIHCQVS